MASTMACVFLSWSLLGVMAAEPQCMVDAEGNSNCQDTTVMLQSRTDVKVDIDGSKQASKQFDIDGNKQEGYDSVRVTSIYHVSSSGESNLNGGKYFYFSKAKWVAVFGAAPSGQTQYVEQWRKGKLIWKGLVKVWDNHNGVHGRRDSGSADKQWKVDDELRVKTTTTTTTTTTAAAFVRVTSIYHVSSSGESNLNGGKYFYFSKAKWVAVFGAAPSGQTQYVEQWRKGKLIWKGLVKVWDNHNGVHGRRDSGSADKQWEVNDEIRVH